MGGSLFTITFPLTPLERSSPFPVLPYVLFLVPFSYRPSIHSSPYPLYYSFSPSRMRSLCFTPSTDSMWYTFAFPFPLSPSLRFPPLHWDLNTHYNSRNGISNNANALLFHFIPTTTPYEIRSFHVFRRFPIPPPPSPSNHNTLHPLHWDLTTRNNCRIGISNKC